MSVKFPLPADLPTDWTFDQIVSPTGAEVGKAQQYGYNYTMEQINKAQEAANWLNDKLKEKVINEIGTMNPILTTASGNYIEHTSNGMYSVIGNQVFISGHINITKLSASNEYMILNGLPFIIGGSETIDIRSGNWLMEGVNPQAVEIYEPCMGKYGAGAFRFERVNAHGQRKPLTDTDVIGLKNIYFSATYIRP